MNPLDQFCHNPDCSARGQRRQGTIRVHRRKERRYRCTACRCTFAHSTETPCYRLQVTLETVTLVLVLMSFGCPLQAIVVAFGLDERTVAAWRNRAGHQAQRFHEHKVLQAQVELGHVQADEFLRVVGRRLGMALALDLPQPLLIDRWKRIASRRTSRTIHPSVKELSN